MKKNLFIACLAILMASCSSKTYYQIVDVKSNDLQKENGNYVYNDGVCKLVYDFWSEGGNAGFRIENLSDEVLNVDLSNTFYIENGTAFDYYRARTYELGKNVQISKGNSGLSTAYGIWNGGVLNGYRGAITYQTSSGVSDVSSYGISFEEKPVVSIPPHSSKSFSEYKIMKDVIQDCSVTLRVKTGKPEGKSYTETESPIRFANYITYKKGENGVPKTINTSFYLAGYTNYHNKDVIERTKVGCKKTVPTKYCTKAAAERFYIIYDNMLSNSYSKDAPSQVSGK